MRANGWNGRKRAKKVSSELRSGKQTVKARSENGNRRMPRMRILSAMMQSALPVGRASARAGCLQMGRVPGVLSAKSCGRNHHRYDIAFPLRLVSSLAPPKLFPSHPSHHLPPARCARYGSHLWGKKRKSGLDDRLRYANTT